MWFWDDFDQLWPEMALWVLWCLNGLHYVNLDVFATPWKKVNIFRIFRVQHANREQIKYGIYNCPFFIWYLNCNERCWIKNVISHFIASKLHVVTAVHRPRLDLPWWRLSCCCWFEKKFLLAWLIGIGHKLFFFGSIVNRSTLTRLALTSGHSICARQTRRPLKVCGFPRPYNGL